MSAKGFGAAAVAVLCFGSNFVSVKSYDAGDGVFFQWVMCASIWFVGLIVQFARDAYIFEPFAALGGALWATGNILSVPLIKMLGMGLAILLWGGANLVLGWATGQWGFFGLKKNTVNKPELNYVGFALAVLSLGIFFFVKSGGDDDDKPKLHEPSASIAILGDSDLITPVMSSNEAHAQNPRKKSHDVQLVGGSASLLDSQGSHDRLIAQAVANSSWVDKLSPVQKKIFGFLGALVAGVLYGMNFDPPQYLMDKSNEGIEVFGRLHSTAPLDYVFSHFSGIFMASTAYFLIYCAIQNNSPQINNRIVLPSFVCGTLWAIAQVCWFVANSELSFVVAFPIITTGPGVIAALWGVLKFKEIKGRRNIGILVAACATTILGVLLIALSKAL